MIVFKVRVLWLFSCFTGWYEWGLEVVTWLGSRTFSMVSNSFLELGDEKGMYE